MFRLAFTAQVWNGEDSGFPNRISGLGPNVLKS